SEAIQDVGIRNVHVLPSGPIPADPTQLLSLPYLKDMLGETAARFDVVLLDTPAILPVIDMALVAPSADGVLLIIRRGKTLRQEIQSAQSQIEEVQGRTLGVVVNDAAVKRSVYLNN
ncbi:MAG: hypothetical protein KC496_15395, partial [Anaerolineae bacterium]|nr:hypothetical protein [Anaerolineae bacterium]